MFRSAVLSVDERAPGPKIRPLSTSKRRLIHNGSVRCYQNTWCIPSSTQTLASHKANMYMKCVSVLVMAFALTAGLGEDSEASRQIQVLRQQVSELTRVVQEQGAALQQLQRDNDAKSVAQNEIVAFHAALTSYDTIDTTQTVLFNQALVNDGNGYNALLGTFTVPPGGAGLYYFSTYLLLNAGEYADFDLRTDDQLICIAWGDHDNSGAFDNSQATCSGLVQLPEGARVWVRYAHGTSSTPLYADGVYFHNGFTGFKLY